MRYVLGLLLIGGIGWYLFSYTKKAKANANSTDGVYRNDAGDPIYAGPSIDPLTGNSTYPGVKAGTVGFSVQPIN